MKNKEYVALVEFFDVNGNSSYKSCGFFASSFLDAYHVLYCKLLDDYSDSEYYFEIITIHKCFPRG